MPRIRLLPPSSAARAARAALVALTVVAAVAAGMGWLYLIRSAAALDAGPHVREALPLQRLARDDAQSLLRLLVAWLPAGLAAGLAIRALWPSRRVTRAAAVGVVAFGVLGLTGAVSDAVTLNEALGGQVVPAFGRAAAWLPALLVALGALIPPPSDRPTGRRAARAAAMRPDGGAGAAI